MEGKVSIIIPVYNISKWIENCLTSIERQTYKNIEIIAIDDGSTDDSLKILNRCCETLDMEMKVVTQSNSGQGAARNRGIDLATGEYVVFIDGDDTIAEDYIEILANKIRDEQLDCVVAGYQRVLEDGTCTLIKKPCAEYQLYKVQMMACCSKIYRLDFLKKENIRFPEKMLYEDITFSWNVFWKTEKIGSVDSCGYFYLDRPGSSSNRKIDFNKVPIKEYESTIANLSENPCGDKELFEYSVLSFFTYFLFVLGRNTKFQELRQLVEVQRTILNNYLPAYAKNRYVKPSTLKSCLLARQRWGIWCYAKFIKYPFFELFLSLYCGVVK